MSSKLEKYLRSLANVIGVFGFGAVIYGAVILTKEMAQAQATLPLVGFFLFLAFSLPFLGWLWYLANHETETIHSNRDWPDSVPTLPKTK